MFDVEGLQGVSIIKLILSHAGVKRRKFPNENQSTMHSRVSEVLKRSSGLRGGEVPRKAS